jgi:hypothetical protein
VLRVVEAICGGRFDGDVRHAATVMRPTDI